ncbi:MAG: YebC/PmpR family DNA-binding transcriptional regulator [Candidatus Peribacteraceae bacterium]|nr:YebC/PmpR family DNA-binding transcriptional regulator [Candidatus Peribacteraceae bacterium]
MSGHSKWANIRVRKGAQDARRNKVYTKHARLIEMAARTGPDPRTNSSLRAAIDNAKIDSVPNDNIERAIKKGSGELKGEAMQEAIYAAYGPGGVACLIECLTDNRNRTTANLKLAISKNGGNFAETGSVAWMFERKGSLVTLASPARATRDDSLELELIDAGAEDISVDGDVMTVITSVNDWTKVRDLLKQKGFEILSAGLSYIAKQKTAVSDQATAEKLEKFVEAVEEDDDVSEVHTNADVH